MYESIIIYTIKINKLTIDIGRLIFVNATPG